MSKCRTRVFAFLFVWLAVAAAWAKSPEPPVFAEGSFERGRLETIDGLPVLRVEGSPAEIGRQEAALIAEPAKQLLSYPKELLAAIDRQNRWGEFVRLGQAMAAQFPEDHLAELDAFAKASGYSRDVLLALNTMVDTYRGSLGCSSLMVSPERSATGGPLFGRNLDFPTLGKLQRYSLVTVCRPERKHAFASIGFPGMFGCLSGMNDAGLAVAVHEIYLSRDKAPMLDPKGVPYTLVFRRVLEECTTVDEARRLIASLRRTTLLSLAMCDRQGGAVLEITPNHVALRRGANGICVATNHFRTPELRTVGLPRRYRTLAAAQNTPMLGLDDVAQKLDEVNLGRLTMQTMIFEPVPLVLHLAIGSCPTSSLPLKRLELAPLFASSTLTRQ